LKAVILAAGEGTRLRPFTNSEPKPMIPIANRPILEYAIEALAANSVTDITMVVGYKKERIMSHFGKGTNWGVNIEYVEQEKRVSKTGTAYALSMVKDKVKGDFLVLPGDNIIGPKLISDLLSQKGKYRVVITESDIPSKYGVVELSGDTVINIVEKPQEHISNLISTGIYKFSDEVFQAVDYVLNSGKWGLSNAIQYMIPRTKVNAVKTSGVWGDVVYPWNILELNAIALQKCAAKTSGRIERGVSLKGPVSIGDGTIIRAGSHILGPVVIGDGCEIGPSACIYPSSSIGDNVRIGPFSVIEHSVLMNDANIGVGSFLSHSVVGEGVDLGPQFCAVESSAKVDLEGETAIVERIGALIGEKTIMGSQVSVKSGSVIGAMCRVTHHTRIDGNVEDNARVT
jgi:UDP-N-acetylglucosamine diphosphorylase/glucosamine-1-phosphate N-acetyltransferase